MKIDKSIQKKCILRIKEVATVNGYKKSQNTIFKVEDEKIILVDFLIVNSEKLIYRINAKNCTFDNIFWKIMKMENNLKKGDAVKINGAFSAPSVLISKGEIALSENVDMIADNFMTNICKDISDFFSHNCIKEFIISNKEIIDREILQCLLYIDENDIPMAIEIANEQLAIGNIGRFQNKGKGFFELLYDYYDI